MRTLSEQTGVEKNLHDLFRDLAIILKAARMTAEAGALPEEVVKKLTDSIVNTMEEAQKGICKDCPILDECKSKGGHGELFNKLRFNDVKVSEAESVIISLLNMSRRN